MDEATIFARVSPEQKARILRAQRDAGSAVAFLGDGVNDALALHHADVGISVDSATDVAKDAADIILLERDLDVLADGVAEGRRIFANTIKYVLMGTSSNFGNMFSVTVAAAFLPFLPMLPFQILLNNLLYDTSQMTIPTDRVDEEQLARPSHWDIAFIRRFMIRFGPISSVFDFATFAVMLWVFDADRARVPLRLVRRVARHPDPHRVRHPHPTRPVPPQPPIATAARLGDRRRHRRRPVPQSPLNDTLGFAPLPPAFFAVLVAFVIAYLICVEAAKARFFRTHSATTERRLRRSPPPHPAHRCRWSHGGVRADAARLSGHGHGRAHATLTAAARTPVVILPDDGRRQPPLQRGRSRGAPRRQRSGRSIGLMDVSGRRLVRSLLEQRWVRGQAPWMSAVTMPVPGAKCGNGAVSDATVRSVPSYHGRLGQTGAALFAERPTTPTIQQSIQEISRDEACSLVLHGRQTGQDPR